MRGVKCKTSFALSKEALRILETKARKLGVSKTAVLEMAIRKLEPK